MVICKDGGGCIVQLDEVLSEPSLTNPLVSGSGGGY